MKYTNKYNLPGSLVSALAYDNYDLVKAPNIFSVTTVIAPPKIKTLEIRHESEIEVDIADKLWSVQGSAMHNVIERANTGNNLVEERWYIDLSDWTIKTTFSGMDARNSNWYRADRTYLSGKMDVYEGSTKTLFDYKYTSVWGWILEGKTLKNEHIGQLAMNSLALTLLGFPVEKAAIIFIFRDWSKRIGLDNPDMHSIMVEYAPIWAAEYAEEAIIGRVKMHLDARSLANDDAIPECTPDERWQRKTMFAVMKPGRKSALRVHDTLEQAEVHMKQDPSYTIVERPGHAVDVKDTAM